MTTPCDRRPGRRDDVIDPDDLEIAVRPAADCPPDRRRLTSLVALALDLARQELDRRGQRPEGGAA